MKTLTFFNYALAASCCLHVISVSAQDGNIFDYNSKISPCVETFEMLKYGGREHNLYSGAMTCSIPLYQYSDPDFNIPVSLKYAFDGFRPIMNSGTVGYGWCLSCGGVITREVNGIADETDWDDRGDVGYLRSIRDGVFDYPIINSGMIWPYMTASNFQIYFPGQYLASQVKNMNLFSDTPMFYDYLQSQPYTRRHYDTSPDLFHFCFNGNQGDFMLKRDGSFEIFNSNVPYGEISIEWTVGHGIDVRNSCFMVSTGDGYRYWFGSVEGTTESINSTLEYSYNGTVWDESPEREFMMGNDDEAWQDFMDNVMDDSFSETVFMRSLIADDPDANYNDWLYSYNPHGTVSAWKLVKIEAPNGRTVEFHYGRTYVDFTREVRYHPAMSYATLDGGLSATSRAYQALVSSFSCPLESVSVDGLETIKFSFSDREADESNVNCYRQYPQLNPTNSNWDSFPLVEMGRVVGNPNSNNLVQQRLSCMSVINSENAIVEQVHLSHFFTSSSSGSSKMFLSGISSLQNGSYTFQYNADSDSVFPLRDTPCVDHWGFWNGDTRLESGDMRGLIDYSGIREGGLYDQLEVPWKDANFQYSSMGALTAITYPTGGRTEIEYEPHSAERLIERDGEHYPSIVKNTYGLVPGGVRVGSMVDVTDTSSFMTKFEYCKKDSLYVGLGSGVLMIMPRYACALNCRIGTMGNFSCMAFSNECDLARLKDSHVVYPSVCKINPDRSVDEYRFVDYEECPDEYGASMTITKSFLSEDYEINSSDQSRFLYKFSPASGDYSALRGRPRLVTHWSTDAMDGRKVSEVEYIYSSSPIGSASNSVYTNMAVCYLKTDYTFIYPVLVDMLERTYEKDAADSIEIWTHWTFNPSGQEKTVKKLNSRSGMYELNEKVYCHEIYSASHASQNLKSYVYSDTERCCFGAGRGSELRCSKIYQYDFTSGNPSPIGISESRGGQPRGTSVEYDSNFRPVRIDYPGGRYTEYTWSSDGRRLLSSTSNVPGNTTTYQWRDLVGLTRLTMPTGQSERYGYDDCNRLESRSDSDGNMTVKYEYHLNNE